MEYRPHIEGMFAQIRRYFDNRTPTVTVLLG
jgi:hypothetical protein